MYSADDEKRLLTASSSWSMPVADAFKRETMVVPLEVRMCDRSFLVAMSWPAFDDPRPPDSESRHKMLFSGLSYNAVRWYTEIYRMI